MKQQLGAILLCGAVCLTGLPAIHAAAFSDISDETTQLAAATLQGLGVVSGTGSNSFRPNDTLTRAELCTMAVNALGLSSQVSSYARKTIFSDVSASAWYNGYVNLAYSQGLMNGYGNGTFHPEEAVTYEQAVAVFLGMLQYTSAEIGTVWSLDYTAFADALGLSDGLSVETSGTITRGEAAVLLYRTLKETVNGTNQPCYETLADVVSTQDVVLLDTDSSYGNGSNLLMVYSIGTEAGTSYYTQTTQQSSSLEGYLGTLLFNSSGQVVGFIPQEGGYEDVTIGTATASELTDKSGSSIRISGDTVVVAGGTSYPYTTTGYLQLAQWSGKTVRLFYEDDGTLACIYLYGGTNASSEAVVATTNSVSSLARQLAITDITYTITKNGIAAETDEIAQYDVGYYDGSSGTLRVSDYKITGYLTQASPSVAAAETVTVAGTSFEVLECAWDSLSQIQLGTKVTLLLTDDCKVAAVYKATEVSASMIGVLAEDGKSVTLIDSGIVISANTIEYDEDDLGSLVTIYEVNGTGLRCSGIVENSRGDDLDLQTSMLGNLELSQSCSIYEWAGAGCVYDLEGNKGGVSHDFEALDWLDTISEQQIAYYHQNNAGQVDILLLENVTGNCYDYGLVRTYSGESGINLGGNSYNSALTITSSDGVSSKYLNTNPVTSDTYVGIATRQHSSGYTQVTAVQTLNRITNISSSAFYLYEDSWYVDINGTPVRVSDQVEICLTNEDGESIWISGETGMTSIAATNDTFTVYYDQTSSGSAQVRILVS